MGTLRTINHPGVEIREYDLSNYTPLVGGTTSLITGFATKGEDLVPLEITSKNAFLSYFGTPTNEAEKHFYYAANEIFSQAGRVIAAKIPYDNTIKNIYLGTRFSVDTKVADTYTAYDTFSAFTLSSADLSSLQTLSGTSLSSYDNVGDYSLSGGTPVSGVNGYTSSGYVLSAYQVPTLSGIAAYGYTEGDFAGYTSYTKIQADPMEAISTSTVDSFRTGSVTGLAANEFIIVDRTRSVLKKDILTKNEVIGYFPVVTTAFNALPIQNMLTMSAFNVASGDYTEWCAVSSVGTSASTILNQNMAISLATSAFYNSNMSKQLAAQFPNISYNDIGQLDNDYMNKIMVTIVAMKNDPNENNKINFSVVESFIGSLDKQSINVDGATDYIGNIINSNSQYIEFYGNVDSNLADATGIYKVISQSASVYGFTSAQTAKNIKTSDILTSLDTIFDRLSNIDEVELDLVTDGGISNIAQYTTDTYLTSAGIYDPDGTANGTPWINTINNRESTEVWRSVIAKYITFCSTTRKDCMAIVDGLRPLVLSGKQKIVRPGTNSTIDIDILGNLKNITGINSNYAAMYIDWFKKLDDFTGTTFWLPPSIIANGIYVYTDRTANYWDAPAGLNRGVVYGAVDIAFNPNGKQMDSIYSKSFNYAVSYPYDGIILEGQKTLQTKPSAFDRVNVRRLFLKLERFTYKTLRYFVYEANNVFLRTRAKDQLTPIFEDVKSRGGIYDYKIIIDESNNVPISIDNNELRCAILIKPTKTAEFIICDFFALSSGTSFSEVSI